MRDPGSKFLSLLFPNLPPLGGPKTLKNRRLFHIICLAFNRSFHVTSFGRPAQNWGLRGKIGHISLDARIIYFSTLAQFTIIWARLILTSKGAFYAKDVPGRKHIEAAPVYAIFPRQRKIRASRRGIQKATLVRGDKGPA